jgi:hypothetical protein
MSTNNNAYKRNKKEDSILYHDSKRYGCLTNNTNSLGEDAVFTHASNVTIL